MFLGLGLLVGFLGFLKLMCPYIEVLKTNVDIFESYYMHLHYLREDSLGSWIRTLILINMLDCGILQKKNIITNIFLQDMASSQNSDPPSPKTATIMIALDKLTLQMNQMQQHNQQ